MREASPVPSRTLDVARLIDDSRFSPRQLVIVILCGLMLLFDGYDGMEIAYVAPSLARQWHLAPSMLTLIFVGSGVSSIFGSLLIGPIADRHGRRLMMLGGAAVMGIASLMGAFSAGPNEFFVWRVVGGFGLAAVMPNAIALGAEFAPARTRSFAVIALYSGYAIGASIGAGLSAQLIPAHGWEIVLIIGGVVPLAMAVLCIPILPESIRFLVLRRPHSAAIAKELRRIDRHVRIDDATIFVTSELAATKSPMRDLFRDGRAATTLLLWLIFTMNIMELIFLSSWTPTLLHNSGIALDRALNVSMVMQVGAIVGGLVTALGMDRISPPAALLPAHLLGVFGVALFGLSIGEGPHHVRRRGADGRRGYGHAERHERLCRDPLSDRDARDRCRQRAGRRAHWLDYRPYRRRRAGIARTASADHLHPGHHTAADLDDSDLHAVAAEPAASCRI